MEGKKQWDRTFTLPDQASFSSCLDTLYCIQEDLPKGTWRWHALLKKEVYMAIPCWDILKEGAIRNVVFFVTDSFNSCFLSFKLQLVPHHLQELQFLIFWYFYWAMFDNVHHELFLESQTRFWNILAFCCEINFLKYCVLVHSVIILDRSSEKNVKKVKFSLSRSCVKCHKT